MNIRTFFEPPPIQERHFDWCAYVYDEYEPGKPVGYGRTEEEAVADLMAQIDGEQDE